MCARPAARDCLLVATGRHDFAELEALGPDIALKDLSDTGLVVDVLTAA